MGKWILKRAGEWSRTLRLWYFKRTGRWYWGLVRFIVDTGLYKNPEVYQEADREEIRKAMEEAFAYDPTNPPKTLIFQGEVYSWFGR